MDISQWREFQIGQLFEIQKGKRLTKADMRNGSINFIGASAMNNGVTAKIANDEYLHKPNTITVNYNGSVGVSFYQSEPYWASDDVNVLYPLFQLNRRIAMFIIPILQRKGNQYAFVDKWKKEYMGKDTINLPSTPDGQPDWVYMEQYIKEREDKVSHFLDLLNISTIEGGGQHIDYQCGKIFKIGDLFSIRNGKGITKEEIHTHPGTLPAIQSGEENNGCIGSIDETYCKGKEYTISNGPCLTVARSGSSGFVAYHPCKCVVGDSAKILEPLDQMSKYVLLFLRASLMVNKRKYTYNDKVTSKGYLQDTVVLPATPDGNPDWDYMEAYMRHLESQQILTYLRHLQHRA